MKRTALIAAALTLALAAGTGALAAALQAPRIQAADGVMQFTGSPNVTTCTGSDGQPYISLTGTYTGSMVSSRAEFNGTSTVQFAGSMNAATGIGTGHGTFQLTNASGQVTVRGVALAVMQSSGPGQREVMRGLLDGLTSTGQTYLANFEAQVSADFTHVTVDYGSNTAGGIPDLAATSNGACA